METVNEKEFIEIKYTGYVQGKVFDSNVDEDLKQIDEKAKPMKTIVIIGEKMLVPGFDKQLVGKEVGKEYSIKVGVKDGFGDRKTSLVKTIPLKVFREKNMQPQIGMVLTFDDAMAKVIAVSGARVIADFNNPLSGKELDYKFTIVKKVNEDKEKAECIFTYYLRFIPEFVVEGDKIVLIGPKEFEMIVKPLDDKFKQLMNKNVVFRLKEEKKPDSESKKDVSVEKKQ